jgi:hypothetical protein
LAILSASEVTVAIQKNDASDRARANLPAIAEVFGVAENTGYTPELVERIAEFQVSVGAKRDGIVGANTLSALDRRGWLSGSLKIEVWPAPGSSAEMQRGHYVALARRLGLGAEETLPLLLGIRGMYPFARRAHPMTHARRYDDTFVLLTIADAPFVFRGATHAYQLTSRESPDLDHDLLGDVGSIMPGRYLLRRKPSELPIFELLTSTGDQRIPCARDLNHNGALERIEQELARTIKQGLQVAPGIGMFALNVLFHPGYETQMPGQTKTFSSIGCQTAPLEALRRLAAAGDEIPYVLAEAEALPRGPSTFPPRIV